MNPVLRQGIVITCENECSERLGCVEPARVFQHDHPFPSAREGAEVVASRTIVGRSGLAALRRSPDGESPKVVGLGGQSSIGAALDGLPQSDRPR